MECVVSGGKSAQAVVSQQRYISSDTQTAQRISAVSGRQAPADSSTSSIFNLSDSQMRASSKDEMRCDSTDQVASSCVDCLSQCLPVPPTDGSTEQMNRRHRTAFSAEQLRTLEAEFQGENYISRQRRNQLAKQLQLPETTVKIWFQNRRMKNKRQQMTSWPLDPRFTDPTLAAMLLQAAVVSGAFPYPGVSSILPSVYRALPAPQFRPAADAQIMEKAVLGQLPPRHPLSAIQLQTSPPASSWKPNNLPSSSDIINAGAINNKLPALFRPFEHAVQY